MKFHEYCELSETGPHLHQFTRFCLLVGRIVEAILAPAGPRTMTIPVSSELPPDRDTQAIQEHVCRKFEEMPPTRGNSQSLRARANKPRLRALPLLQVPQTCSRELSHL